jgi:hypothetical protein
VTPGLPLCRGSSLFSHSLPYPLSLRKSQKKVPDVIVEKVKQILDQRLNKIVSKFTIKYGLN